MRHRVVLILVSALLFFICLMNYRPWRGYDLTRRVEYGAEAMRVTRSLLHERAFADPFGALRTGPTAHVAPGFPFLLFLILNSLGEGRNGWLVLRVLPVLALGLQLALLPWVARLIGYSPQVGFLASIFGLLSKPDSEPLWEAHLAGLLSLVLISIACRFQLNERRALVAVATGMLAGVAFQFQPVLALPYFCWIMFLLLKKRLTNLFVVGVLPLIMCVPWSVRNYREIGTPAMRDNLGLELYVSFNDCAPYGIEESLNRLCHGTFHPNSSIEEAEAVRRLGELRYNHNRLHAAFVWVSAHPKAAGVLIAKRFWFFWFPSNEGLGGYRRERARSLFLHIFTLTSVLGLYLSWKRRVLCLELLSVFLALFPVIYYLVEFDARYRYPILWITWILAASAILEWFNPIITRVALTASSNFGHAFKLIRAFKEDHNRRRGNAGLTTERHRN